MNAPAYLDPTAIAYIALALCLVGLLVLVVILLRQGKMLNRYRHLLQNGAKQDIEQLLLSQADDIDHLKHALSTAEQRIATLATEAESHVQRLGVVRFNAFPDTGSDLSFAIAILDAHNAGFVLSSLYGRQESRTYAKPIRDGKSTYTLSEEEKEAIAIAMRGQKGQAQSEQPSRK